MTETQDARDAIRRGLDRMCVDYAKTNDPAQWALAKERAGNAGAGPYSTSQAQPPSRDADHARVRALCDFLDRSHEELASLRDRVAFVVRGSPPAPNKPDAQRAYATDFGKSLAAASARAESLVLGIAAIRESLEL
jgi:hypothetical protein